MQVSIETLAGLKRKLTVSLPAAEIEEKVESKLRDLSRKARIDGFRQGKVPLRLVKDRFGSAARLEVVEKLLPSSIDKAVKESKLELATRPEVSIEQMEPDKDLIYTLNFEINPEFEIKELNKDEVDVLHAEVTDQDFNNLLQKLQTQHQTWSKVDGPIEKGDKIDINFKGYIDGEEVVSLATKNYTMVAGEDELMNELKLSFIGATTEEELEKIVKFPKNYNNDAVADKKVTLKIVINSIERANLPELNDEFAKQFFQQKNFVTLCDELKKTMVYELKIAVAFKNRQQLFDKLCELNEFPLPELAIENEINHLRHEMHHQIFKTPHVENEKIFNFPRELFEVQARKNVHLRLLLKSYIEKHKIESAPARIDEIINEYAVFYEKPQDFVNEWSHEDKRESFAQLALEEEIAKKIGEHATLIDKNLSYDEIMNPSKQETLQDN